MSKFFVGQRVRLVRPINPKRIGEEGFINHVAHIPKGTMTRLAGPTPWDADCGVNWDPSPNQIHACAFWQIEPILPEGAQPLGYSFEQMMSEFWVTEAVK